MTSPHRAPVKYDSTAENLMRWARSELEHIGRIVSIKDKKIQYTYALSTLNGMAHLKDALYEFISTNPGSNAKKDLMKTHESVIRAMRHLYKTYKLDLSAIEAFNTQHTLSTLNYIRNDYKTQTRAQKRSQRKTRRGRKSKTS